MEEQTQEVKKEDIEKEHPQEELFIPKEVYDLEMNKIKANPREYICSWMESNLLHVGKRVFKFLSLLPASLIIPSISFNSTDIKVNFNVLLLASPSSGKSTIAKKLGKFSYMPIEARGMSAKKLFHMIYEQQLSTIIIEDFSTIGADYEIIKILEGALGDEKTVSMSNMRYDLRNTNTQNSGLLCGTWSDLNRYLESLRGGLFSRMVLVFVSLTQKQKEEIADFINNGIGNRSSSFDSKIKEKIVQDYYQNLFNIQTSSKRIVGYLFRDDIKNRGLALWKKITKDSKYSDFKRELHDYYRFLCSSAFLNYYNRRIDNGIIEPNEEDCQLALELMEESLKNKIAIYNSRMFLKNVNTPEDFLKLLNNNLKDDIKNILINLSPFGHLAVNNMAIPRDLKK